MSLVLLPGLGADRRLFDPQRKTFPDLIVPEWIPPLGRETLTSYARRLSEGPVSALAPLFLGGASFGGMIALEMARHLRPKGVFLIGSCRSPSAIPPPRRVLGRLLRRFPLNLFDAAKSSEALLSATLGPCRPDDAALALEPVLLMSCYAPAILSLRAECSKNLLCGVALLRLRAVFLCSRSRFGLAALATDITRTDSKRMVQATSGEFLRWGFSAILDWKGCEDLAYPVYQIHGSRDRLLPLSRVSADAIVAGGGHLLTLTHPGEVGAFLTERMRR